MSKSNLKSNIEWLSDPKIAITVAVLVVVAIALVAFGWKKIKGLFKGIGDGIKDNKTDKELEDKTGTSLTDLIDYRSLCAQIWDASVNATFNDPDRVCSALSQLQSRADYEKLKLEWMKYVQGLSWWERNWHAFSETKYSLPAWLAADFNENNLNRFRNILRSINVTPDF